MSLATLRGGRRDERGSILVLSGVGLVLALICASLAVDLGMLAHEIRENQKVADLAALDAARVLPADPNPAAQESALRNGFPTEPGYSVTAVEGVKVTSGGEDSCLAQPGAGTVCVTATSRHKNFFPFVADGQSKSRVAVAGPGNAIGTVRVGSNVASADGTISPMQDKLLDKTIASLIGGNYSTDAVGWQGVASGDVTFAALTSALATVTGNGTFNAGTTEEVLDSTFTMGQLTTAMANVLNNNGNSSVAATVAGIGGQATSSQSVTLREMFGIGSVVVGNKEDVANATLNVLDLIKAGAILADDDHFASFNLVASDIVGGQIAGGFSGATVSMGLIEAPQTSFPGAAGRDAAGEYYTQAHTSQLRVRVELGFDIPLTSVGLPGVISLKIPYYLDLGRGHAYLETINCASSAEPVSVEILGATDVGVSGLGVVSDAYIKGEAANPAPQAGVLGTALSGTVKVSLTSASSTIIPGNNSPGTLLTFTPPYEEDSPSQPVPGTGVSLPALATTNTTATVSGIVSTGLLNDVISGVNASGLTFGSNTVGVNTSILKPLYDALGMSFGGADIWAPPVQNCAALSPLGPIVSTNPPVLRG